MKTTLYCSVYIVLIGHHANGPRTIWACSNKQLFREDRAAGNRGKKNRWKGFAELEHGKGCGRHILDYWDVDAMGI